MQIKDLKTGLIFFGLATAAAFAAIKINEKLHSAKLAPLAPKA